MTTQTNACISKALDHNPLITITPSPPATPTPTSPPKSASAASSSSSKPNSAPTMSPPSPTPNSLPSLPPPLQKTVPLLPTNNNKPPTPCPSTNRPNPLRSAAPPSSSASTKSESPFLACLSASTRCRPRCGWRISRWSPRVGCLRIGLGLLWRGLVKRLRRFGDEEGGVSVSFLLCYDVLLIPWRGGMRVCFTGN